MNRLAFAKTLMIGLLTLGIGGSAGGGGQEDGKKKASVWMKAKTQFTQDILIGLTEGDYEKIENSAKALGVADFLEYWFRAKQPNYRKQMMFFAHANQEVIRHAKAKNLAGVTLAFNQLTASCVECHQIVRDAKK
jgi:hypothetical protein